MTDLNQSLAMLKSPNASVRAGACEELRLATQSSPEIVLALEEATKDDNRLVVERAILALAADVHQQVVFKMSRVAPPGETVARTQGKIFVIRSGAYILDMLVVNLVFIAFLSGTDFLPGAFATYLSRIAQINISLGETSGSEIVFLGVSMGMLYFMIFEWLYGASPAKIILHMRVVKENGDPCNFVSALIRGVLRLVDSLFFGMVALISMKAPLQQRIGDQVAGTIVVDANDPVIKVKYPQGRFFAALCLVLGIWVLLYAGVIMTSI